ncbi:MAG: hypothetical protein ACOYN2_02195 [Patescibacteria group bacterium]
MLDAPDFKALLKNTLLAADVYDLLAILPDNQKQKFLDDLKESADLEEVSLAQKVVARWKEDISIIEKTEIAQVKNDAIEVEKLGAIEQDQLSKEKDSSVVLQSDKNKE